MPPFNFTVFLSASVPDVRRARRFQRVANAQKNVEEAVMSICRSIFEKKGRVIFGGHPSISPFVGMIATEFSNALRGYDEPVVMFQSRLFDKVTKPENLKRLYELESVKIEFKDVVGNEVYDFEFEGPQCPLSLGLLRDSILAEQPNAMICIGGMEGVIEEHTKFRENPITATRPAYILPFTGGAATILAESQTRTRYDIVVSAEELKSDGQPLGIFPYPLIADQIVTSINNQ